MPFEAAITDLEQLKNIQPRLKERSSIAMRSAFMLHGR